MNRSEIEQLTDEIIGEAVLFLLKESLPINIQALIRKLRVMKDEEPDAQRRKLISQVIAEVSNTVVATRRKPIPDVNALDRDARKSRDNVYQLFEDNQQPGNSKKH
ncbi:hypothetical protein GV764_06150 [Atlantibacter hermannii]|uniref:hypothetical protein n=1 Tax=Atlantibacter hermannii TaxID=565 RepID=UPI001379079A|nr:hypothetical protein [Atlantibacter hermannii]NBC98602.1 hypothetical protein [Atlantibacter hermannii]